MTIYETVAQTSHDVKAQRSYLISVMCFQGSFRGCERFPGLITDLWKGASYSCDRTCESIKASAQTSVLRTVTMRRFSLLAGLVLCFNMDVSSSLGEPAGCQSPTPLEAGDVKSSMKVQYSHNERVEYVCQNLYTMEGGPFRTCTDGEWTGHIRCLKPCIVSDGAMRQRNIALKFSYGRKLYTAHNDAVQFRCTQGRSADSMRQYCNDGAIFLPSCH